MKHLVIIAYCLLCVNIQAQSLHSILEGQKKHNLQVGDSAPDFILTVDDNTIRSFTLPQLKKIALLHFWNSSEASSKIDNGHLVRLLDHYGNASYINAAGFEIIAIAVQSDLNTWRNAISRDSLNRFTHGMASKILEDDVCKSYNISTLPSDILVDETGIVIAINPRMLDVENLLDARKNYQAIQKDISGVLATPSNKKNVLQYAKLSLFNYYGDSIAKTTTNSQGQFILHDLKLNQDFILKVNDAANGGISYPVGLFTKGGDLLLESKAINGSQEFMVETGVVNSMLIPDSASLTKHSLEEIDVIKSLTFSEDGKKLTAHDEKDLNVLVTDMLKNPQLMMEYEVHTDSKVDAGTAMEITSLQVQAIKNYFQKRGLDLCHITGIAKGNSELRKDCPNASGCSEEDHKLNRRVEFFIFKELTE